MGQQPTALNTPATAVAPIPGQPIITIPPGSSSALPMGGTVQIHPTQKNSYMHVDPSAGAGGLPGTMRTMPGGKFPYVGGNSLHQYDIIITRLTDNIAGALPWIIGIGDEIDNDFSDFIGQIPGCATNTIGSLTKTAGGILDFSYTVSGATDHVQISCTQTPYTRLVKMWDIHRFYVNQARVGLSDTTALSQFNTAIRKGSITNDSDITTTPLSYTAYNSPYQFESYKVDLTKDVYMSRSEGLLGSIINDGISNFQVTFSIFVGESAPTFTQIGTTGTLATTPTN